LRLNGEGQGVRHVDLTDASDDGTEAVFQLGALKFGGGGD
jgi:hypothetical protein